MSMTLEQAAKNIGEKVTYQAYAFARDEVGEIIDVKNLWVMVKYYDTGIVKATAASQLTLLPQSEKKEDEK